MKTHDLIEDLDHHKELHRIVLLCSLGAHGYGKIVHAEVTEVSPSNHVLAIGDDRFGVYLGYYSFL